jgi:N-acetylglucosamine-6-sulfatase
MERGAHDGHLVGIPGRDQPIDRTAAARTGILRGGRITIEDEGRAATAANVDGRSLVPLLHGHPVTEWRKAVLVEHHGHLKDAADPDFPGKRGGNPPSYEAIRGLTWVYVEYDTGEKEYHDRTTDPDELHNTYASLPDQQKASLHTMLTELVNCHDAQSCAAVDGSSRSALRN